MRTLSIAILFSSLCWTSCSRQQSASSVFQMRLVANSPTADTEQLTILRSLTEASSTNAESLHVSKQVLLDQRAVSSAIVHTQGVSPMIEIVLTGPGTKTFADVTRRNVGKRLGIVVDGQLLAAPRIEMEIPGGRAQITGAFSFEQARELAQKINDGVTR